MAPESITPIPNLSARCTLLAMPPEIRLHIYQFCIPQNMCTEFPVLVYYRDPRSRRLYCDGWPEVHTDADESAFPGLLLLCRQITNEVKPMLYGRTTFVFEHTFAHGHHSFPFSPETKKLMREVIIKLRGNYPAFPPLHPGVWDDILLNLRQLGVIIEDVGGFRSLRAPPFFDRPPRPERTASFTTIFEYLGQALPNETHVVVDTNKREQFNQIIENQMPGRCVFQELRVRHKCNFSRWTWGIEDLL
ncbi:hypothetical protein CEP54_015605 [Fusarium duplospermum]|uniref:Uncharacterized protein n=1 Tax=Fusarium duplospermum TaxID=1325734 RepID=A0A428NMS2_9HYPO|nr:hypothetical protein CEP54_015605 [Fusarium duplospermum]